MDRDRTERAARICCLDLDTFFVSVERLLDPTLEGKPVIVGGRAGERGVVTAASYEVRAFGVKSGMSMFEATRLAPKNTVFLPTRHGTYGPYAEQVRTILERFSPIVQTASIDEFFLDFRGCDRLYRTAVDADDDAAIERTVRAMCRAIREEVGLPASAGIGTSRMVAKIGSGLAKPAGVLLVRAGRERQVIGPLPVRKVPGIGPATEARLDQAGIKTVDQLLGLPSGKARARFGELALHITRTFDGPTRPLGADRPAFLEHDVPVAGGAPHPQTAFAGSISNERTFHEDVEDPTVLEAQLRMLAERVSWRARQRGARACTVHLKLRYSDFETLTRSVTILPTHHEGDIYQAVLALYARARTRPTPIRLLGVGLSQFVGEDPQLRLPFQGAGGGDLLPERPLPGSAIDAVRERFGYDAIRLGTVGSPSRWISTDPSGTGRPRTS
jgi:DNA polymerase IV